MTAIIHHLILTISIVITLFNYLLFINMVWFYKPPSRVRVVTSNVMSQAVIISSLLLTIVQLITCAMIVTGNPPEVQKSGIKIYKESIGIQVVFVLCLLGLIVTFHTAMVKVNNPQRLECKSPQWRKIAVALYISLSAILIRIAYRLIELSRVFRPNSFLPHKEMFFYGFETLPVLIALSVWTIVPTGYLTQPSCKEFEDDLQEILETGREETVPLTEADAQEGNNYS